YQEIDSIVVIELDVHSLLASSICTFAALDEYFKTKMIYNQIIGDGDDNEDECSIFQNVYAVIRFLLFCSINMRSKNLSQELIDYGLFINSGQS
ncbi:unnamed protein product, partial [Rotaria socialis]